MITETIKTKYPKLPYLLFSLIIFVFIAKSYAIYIYVGNLDVGIPRLLDLSLVWGYRFLLVLLLLFIKWNIYDMMFLAAGLGISLIAGNGSLFVFFVLAVFIKTNKINENYIIKNFMLITASFFLGIVFLNLIKVIPNSADVHLRNGVTRNDFGFGNPNSPFLACLPLYAGYIYLRYDEYNLYDRVLLVAISFLIYSQTYSRTGLITILGILVFIEILKRLHIKDNKYSRLFVVSLPVLITLASFFTGLFLNNKVFNALLSGRPRLWNIYVKHIRLFNNESYFTLRKNYPLDNSYIYSFVLFGILVTVFWLAVYTYYMNKNVNLNNGKILAVTSIFLIYSFGENILFINSLNFTLILALASLPIKEMCLGLTSKLKKNK